MFLFLLTSCTLCLTVLLLTWHSLCYVIAKTGRSLQTNGEKMFVLRPYHPCVKRGESI